jgi:FeS assembly SUF system regulator
MFRLNRLTDYAVVVMAQMAQRRDQVRTAPRIAEETGVPLPTVAKILNALTRDTLVVSQRGAAGGYTLSRPAEQITVAEIIQALEGPIALTACVDGARGIALPHARQLGQGQQGDPRGARRGDAGRHVAQLPDLRRPAGASTAGRSKGKLGALSIG